MAETAALNSAYAHVRKANEEAQQVRWPQAADEYNEASAEFARASKTTGDAEALRVLKLLEDQHQRLARIVRTKHYAGVEITNEDTKSALPTTSNDASTTKSSNGLLAEVSSKPEPSTLKVARTSGKPRESSPSLARDIASRRGIPQSKRSLPSSASQAKTGRLSPESNHSKPSTNASKVPPSIVDSQADLKRANKARQAQDDEGFSKFYSNLTSGTVSSPTKLSSQDLLDAVSQQATTPDVKKIFSKAALEAIEDDHRQRGTLGHGFGPAESFYVVQKGGGTYSYADIARAHKLSNIEEDKDGDFVDAREVISPSSPKHNRLQRSSFGSARTNEELDLENTTLKQTLEQVASRLKDFEAHAQDASMAALTQSMIQLKPPPSQADSERLRQLETQMAEQAEEKQKLEALASKQEKMLKKYQAKWEEIKKSAKEKERVKKERSERGGDDSGQTLS